MNIAVFKKQYAFYIAIAVSILLILQQYTDYLINGYDFEFSWFSVSSKIIINFTLWAILFQVLLKVANKLLERKKRFITIIYQGGISIIISTLHRVIAVRLYDLVYYLNSGYFRDFLTTGNQVQLGAGFFSSFIQYWIIIVFIVAALYYMKFVDKQKELNSAQLNALKMQLQPHFLFNTLNSIASLIDIDKKKAQKMLAQFGFLMREILERDKEQYMSFENELKYIKTYLDIEHIRFQDRLTVSYDMDPKLLKAKTPSLILQPIIENSIKHGISKCPDGGEISISAKTIFENNKEYLEISVINNYCQKVNKDNEGYGIGTVNVRKRLEQLYEQDYQYNSTIINEKYVSKIIIPLEYNLT